MAMNFNDPNQFLQLLFSPQANPQMLDQMAGQLAMKMPPPMMPQAPQAVGMPQAQMQPMAGFNGLAPMQGLPQADTFPQPPGAAQLPPGTVMSGMDSLMPGETGGMPVDPNKMLQAALTAQQMQAYQQMLDPGKPPMVSPPSPPGGRQIGAMQQLQMPQGPAMPMSLAALLGGRR